MKSWTTPPANNTGRAITTAGTRRAPEVITPAGRRSSSKLATHTAAPASPTRHK